MIFLKSDFITICLRLRQIRELSKLPEYYINTKKLMAKMRSKKILKNGK